MKTILDGLNENQLQAIENLEGYTRVVAGPGSGKTKTLTAAYATLIEEYGIPETNILCITFTNKAMREIKERVGTALGRRFNSKYITTYHGFCLKVLKDNMNYFNFPNTINILDNEDKKSILKAIYKELGISNKDYSYNVVLAKISSFKSLYIENYVDFLSNPMQKDILGIDFSIEDRLFKYILVEYLRKQRDTFYLDFDDIINFVYVMFKDKNAYISHTIEDFSERTTVLEYYQNKLNYILIDEYQDSDNIQIEIARMLSLKHGNLFVVGDPDQSIYEWRGAKPQYFVDFDKYNNNCTDVFLNQNYRSTKKIVKASNSLIKHNKVRLDKDMFTDNPSGENILYFHGENESEEAKWVCEKIKGLIKSDVNPEEIAILYRSNYQSRFIEDALIKNNISYSIWGGTKFFERKEIKDLISYLKLVHSNDDIAFSRIINVPRRKMGDKKIEFIKNISETENLSLFEALSLNYEDTIFKSTNIKLFLDVINYCRENNLSPSESIEYILKHTGYIDVLKKDLEEDRIENLNELVRFTKEFEKSDDFETGSIDEFLDYISLYTDKDDNESNNSIKLLTMHTSKGLEFDYVFIVGLTEGVIPNSKAISDRGTNGLEEERRTMYVAMTRARKELYLSDSFGYSYDGNERNTSRFINEIGEDNIESIATKYNSNNIQKDSHSLILNKSLINNLKVGDLVHHRFFGDAKVVDVDNLSRTYKLEFNNEKTKAIKTISMNFRGLKKYKK